MCRFKNQINLNQFKGEQQITLSEKYKIIHILNGDLLSLNKNVISWRFFFRRKNGKFQSPKSSICSSTSVKKSYTTLQSLSLLSKSISKTMGNLKESF